MTDDRQKRYRDSPRGREVRAAYFKSPRGREVRAAWLRSPRGRELRASAKRRYRARVRMERQLLRELHAIFDALAALNAPGGITARHLGRPGNQDG